MDRGPSGPLSSSLSLVEWCLLVNGRCQAPSESSRVAGWSGKAESGGDFRPVKSDQSRLPLLTSPRCWTLHLGVARFHTSPIPTLGLAASARPVPPISPIKVASLWTSVADALQINIDIGNALAALIPFNSNPSSASSWNSNEQQSATVDLNRFIDDHQHYFESRSFQLKTRQKQCLLSGAEHHKLELCVSSGVWAKMIHGSCSMHFYWRINYHKGRDCYKKRLKYIYYSWVILTIFHLYLSRHRGVEKQTLVILDRPLHYYFQLTFSRFSFSYTMVMPCLKRKESFLIQNVLKRWII